MDHLRPLHRWLTVTLLFILVFAGSGCMTGDRPSLAESTSTGNADVDSVLTRVGQLSAARYSAHYDVLVRYGDVTTAVSASQSEGDRRALTIGDVRYVVHGQVTKTCTMSTGACVGRIDPARVSDFMMTPDFFGTSLIARIRLDVSRAVGQPMVTTEEIQAQQATCVAIPVADGATTYCVLDNGVLARLDAPDLVVTMTSYSAEIDEMLYAEGSTTTTTEAAADTTPTSAVDLATTSPGTATG